MATADLIGEAVEAATEHRSVTFGPIPVGLSGSDARLLDGFSRALLGSSAGSWPRLDVVVASASAIPGDALPPELRPGGTDLAVARHDDVTALVNGVEGTLWLLDRGRATAMLWIADVGGLPLWEHTSPLRAAARWWSAVHGSAMVHAGVVADDENCVLLVGSGGAGKSTTTMACHASGLDVLGDDYCIVEPGADGADARAHAMYSQAKLDDASLDLLPGLRSRVAGVAWQGKKLIDLGSEPKEPRRIVAVCHVVRDPRAPTRAMPVPRAQVLRASAPSTLFQLRLWEKETWGALAATVRSVPGYRLSVSDPGEAPDVLREILVRRGS